MTTIAIEDENSVAWNVIDKYARENIYFLVQHLLEPYNNFIDNIPKIFRENNPILFVERGGATAGTASGALAQAHATQKNECQLFVGGKNGDKIYFGKPTIYENGVQTPLYPNIARLRKMNYDFTLHVDIDVVYKFWIEGSDEPKIVEDTIHSVDFGKFPIMLHSNLCYLRGMATEVRFNLGECRNDLGGYFIADGAEKCVVSQVMKSYNTLYVRLSNDVDDPYIGSCEVRSKSENESKPIRYTAVRMVSPDSRLTNRQIVVDLPNVRAPIPLFIVMRALGIISDRDIIEICLLDMDRNSELIELFAPSIHDANRVFTQYAALEFIASYTKRQNVVSALEILMDYFLPHMGELTYREKAFYLGYMVYRLLRVITKKELPTDRDSSAFKRVETPGDMMYQLFREYWLLNKRAIALNIDKKHYFQSGKYQGEGFLDLITTNSTFIFGTKVVESGFKKAIKGNWGSTPETKRVGVSQPLNRLSYWTAISHLRKTNMSISASNKDPHVHYLNATSIYKEDPIDTPDGANIGLMNHLSICGTISNGYSAEPLVAWIKLVAKIVTFECSPKTMSTLTKVFVNGNWIGGTAEPLNLAAKMRLWRRNGLLPIYTSVCFSYKYNDLYIYTDAGRRIRPIFFKGYDTNRDLVAEIEKPKIDPETGRPEYVWPKIAAGSRDKPKSFHIRNNRVYLTISELYGEELSDDVLSKTQSLIEYLDANEEESALIESQYLSELAHKHTTHKEIHQSLMFGIMGNSVNFPEHNPMARNCFSCSQSKQACSLYHQNYQVRFDKMGVVLQYGQMPLVKSRYLEYINRGENPYGNNVIVALMCHSGYNVEDAILINEASIKRGLFRTLYFSSYSDHETRENVGGAAVNRFFADVSKKENVRGLKPGVDYSSLDEFGLVREGTVMNDKIALIGKLASTDGKTHTDETTVPKKGQLGIVDKSFVTEGEEGFRIARIRICEERIPAIGDKFASRAGQKGTIGRPVPEEDMPYIGDGIRPDIVVNPHAIPTRMTIGQLIECLCGSFCSEYGFFGDCTAFANKGHGYEVYGKLLQDIGFHSSGCHLMHNGRDGYPIGCEVFVGPTYYMRLKHMVKDKINYREQGPRVALTRQTNGGRADDGGLRLGEMERDGVLGHGAMAFLKDSFMTRGDAYQMAVCNKSGAIAIYNPFQKLFLSPAIDGPMKFTETMDGKKVIENRSEFGRDFSIVECPYTLKLLIQELQTAQIHMKIITDANVNQLMNLAYNSGTLQRTLRADDGAKIEDVLANYRKVLMDIGIQAPPPVRAREPVKRVAPPTAVAPAPETPKPPEWDYSGWGIPQLAPTTTTVKLPPPPIATANEESPPFNPADFKTKPEESPPFNPSDFKTKPEESPPFNPSDFKTKPEESPPFNPSDFKTQESNTPMGSPPTAYVPPDGGIQTNVTESPPFNPSEFGATGAYVPPEGGIQTNVTESPPFNPADFTEKSPAFVPSAIDILKPNELEEPKKTENVTSGGSDDSAPVKTVSFKVE